MNWITTVIRFNRLHWSLLVKHYVYSEVHNKSTHIEMCDTFGWRSINETRVPRLTIVKQISEYWKRQHKVGKIGSRYVWSTQLGNSTPCGLLTRLGSLRLPLACIDTSRICWAALWFLRRCEKMARWMVAAKGDENVFKSLEYTSNKALFTIRFLEKIHIHLVNLSRVCLDVWNTFPGIELTTSVLDLNRCFRGEQLANRRRAIKFKQSYYYPIHSSFTIWNSPARSTFT